VVDDIREKVGLELRISRLARSREVEHLLGRHFAEVLAQPIEQRRLRGVHAERLVLLLEAISAYLDASGYGQRRDWHTVRQHEISRAVIELLRPMRRQALR